MTAIVDWTFLPTVVWFLLRALVRTIVGICAFWRWLPRRPVEPGFPYVYVNQDGSARELSPDEQKWLSIAFEPGDGGRPYIKGTYEGRDSGNRRSGFLPRRLLPARVRIAAVHPVTTRRSRRCGKAPRPRSSVRSQACRTGPTARRRSAGISNASDAVKRWRGSMASELIVPRASVRCGRSGGRRDFLNRNGARRGSFPSRVHRPGSRLLPAAGELRAFARAAARLRPACGGRPVPGGVARGAAAAAARHDVAAPLAREHRAQSREQGVASRAASRAARSESGRADSAVVAE